LNRFYKSPAGKPRPLPVVKLPPLLIEIHQNGKFLRFEEMPDPREAYCRSYNDHRLTEDSPTAHPVDAAAISSGANEVE
jgi:hypothetical protein